DAVEGIRCGNHIADYVFTHAATPSSGPVPTTLPSMAPQDQIDLAVQLEVVAANGGLKPGRGRRRDPGSSAAVDMPSASNSPLSPAAVSSTTRASLPTTGGSSAPELVGRAIDAASDFATAGHFDTNGSLDSAEEWAT